MRSATLASLMVTMLAGACGGSAPEQPNAEAEQAQQSSVSVRLDDYVVEAEPDSVPAGQVTFEVRNDGGNHDLHVLRTDLSAADLPEDEVRLAPGVKALKADLEAPEIEVLGSTEVLDEGGTASLTLDLESGHYVLICDLVDFDDAGKAIGSHYAQGMRTDLSVR
jgi:hypothetical protein